MQPRDLCMHDDDGMSVTGAIGHGSYESASALDAYAELDLKADIQQDGYEIRGRDDYVHLTATSATTESPASVRSPLWARAQHAYMATATEVPNQRRGNSKVVGDYDDVEHSVHAQEAVLSAVEPHCSFAPVFSITSPRSVNSNRRSNRVSLVTCRSLYNIHEPEQDSALGLALHGEEQPSSRNSTEWSYNRSTASPSSVPPSLTDSSPVSSAGHSTGYSTPVARRYETFEHIKEKKEKKVGKALLGKLKSILLAPVSPASAQREIKQATKPRRGLRRNRKSPPAIEQRTTSLYRTVDVPDPLVPAPFSRDRRASALCSGPYGNLAAYGAAFESTASVAFRPSNFASVADFRHYSTQELPLDPTVPYSPYAAQESARYSTLLELSASPALSGDLTLGTDKVKLRQKSGSDWASKSKQFWTSALDLTLARSNRHHTMSTVELASPQPVRSSAGLIPAPPPIPARSRLRASPAAAEGNKRQSSNDTTSTPRTPMTQLPSSPSDSSIGSSTSAQHGSSPGLPVTPNTPAIQGGTAVPSESHNGWPGKLEQTTSPVNSVSERKRSRFSRGRHSSGSVSLSAYSDPLRVKDGIAPKGSASGIYTPPTFPGPSRPVNHSQNPSYSSTFTVQPSRSGSGSSDTSYSSSSSYSIPQTPTSPSAAASRMYNACVGALSGWSMSGIPGAKRASNPAKPISAPLHSPVHVDAGPMSASAAYFPPSQSRMSSFSSRHQTSRSVSYSSTASNGNAPVQVWSPEHGWSVSAGLGVGVEEEGNYVQGRTRSSTSATNQPLGPAVIMADAPKGRRKPVPRVEGETEVHAL